MFGHYAMMVAIFIGFPFMLGVLVYPTYKRKLREERRVEKWMKKNADIDIGED